MDVLTQKNLTIPLLGWYASHARALPWRESREPYRVWLSEIMLQQTRVETVLPYYARFLGELPTLRSLADAPESRVLKLWEGLGYYSRARNLQKAARAVMSRHGGEFPRELTEIRALPGIGDYTAAAVASICFELAAPAVDGNVLRVVSRLTGDDTPLGAPRRREDTAELLRPLYIPGRCGDFTQSLMELGALVCLPGAAARCAECPVSAVCGAYHSGDAARLPVRAEKKARAQADLTVLLLTRGDTVAVRRRPSRGLLAALWELPNFPGAATADEARALAETLGVSLASVSAAGPKTRKHVFTHMEWRMTCYHLVCEAGAEGRSLTWASPRELREGIALPTAFRKALDAF
ncbi:MAG: A/G-specific adenine glycosylase [Oscillospiraceae bacterium]|nr:A/G-specific adenine glycosylase [Oscillospiraceae bacterium]